MSNGANVKSFPRCNPNFTLPYAPKIQPNGRSKVAKRVLKQDAQLQFLPFGIVSSIKDYRLCWFINKALNFDLHREEDIELHLPDQRKLFSFSHFRFDIPVDDIIIHFVQNKGPGGFLLQKISEFDYFLIIEGSSANSFSEDFQEKLRDLEVIQLVRELDAKHFKEVENLIFD